MLERIKVGEIKRALVVNRRLATESSLENGGYDHRENEWGVRDYPTLNFGETFNVSLPAEYERNLGTRRFRKYIEEVLSNGEKHDRFAIEFGGPGSKLFEGFTDNFFKRTVGVCLKDIRTKSQKDHDAKSEHSVVEGDILNVQNNELLIKVSKILGTRKIDLIISRMELPLKTIDRNGAILDRIIRNWYDMLNENGLMFIQFEWVYSNEPLATQILIKKWSKVIEEKFPQIDIQVEKAVLRLHKKVDAPEELPPATQLFK